jgi:hypothetical protein
MHSSSSGEQRVWLQLHIVPKNRTVAEVDTLGLCIMRDQAVGLLLTIADELGVSAHPLAGACY